MDYDMEKSTGPAGPENGGFPMAYEILTDSCCDFSREMYRKLKLTALPLTVNFRDASYPDRNADSLKDMYDGFRAGEAATTAALNPQSWSEAMKTVLNRGADVLVIAFSSGLSTTCQSAMIAARELAEAYPQRKIRVCDSLCASLGQGLIVYLCWQQQQAGRSIEEVRDYAEKIKLNVCHWFTVDDLMFLKRGGRVSAATAIVGSMLSIKPVMHVDNEGHLIKVDTARGRKASIRALVAEMEKRGTDLAGQHIFISHGDCEEDAKYLASLVREKCGVKDVTINYVGPVIGAHSGPGTLALFFVGTER